MKLKRTLLILTAVMAAAISACVSAAAAHASDLLYTGIGAYINHYPITSFACDGKTVVAAEDLRSFGFTVNWNAYTKTLDIQTDPYCTSIIGMSGVKKHSALTGKKYASAQNNAVTAYVNDVWLNSYTYNGYTYVALEDLAAVGEFTWDEYTRSSRLWLNWLPITQYQPIPEDPNDKYLLEPQPVQEWHDPRYDTKWVYASGMELLVPKNAEVDVESWYTQIILRNSNFSCVIEPAYYGNSPSDIIQFFKNYGWQDEATESIEVLSENNTYFAGKPARQLTFINHYYDFDPDIYRAYAFMHNGMGYIVYVCQQDRTSWSDYGWWAMELIRTGSKMAF